MQKLMYAIRFRWAACQLDSLGSCLNVYGLRKRLASLPKDLDEIHARDTIQYWRGLSSRRFEDITVADVFCSAVTT